MKDKDSAGAEVFPEQTCYTQTDGGSEAVF